MMNEVIQLKNINDLLNNSKFTEALKEIKHLEENQKDFSSDTFLKLQNKRGEVLNYLGRYSKTIENVQKIKEEARKQDNKKQELTAINHEIFAYYRLTKLNKAIQLIPKADIIVNQLNEEEIRKQTSKLFVNKAYVYVDRGKLNQANIFAQNNLYLCKYMGDQEMLARAYHVVGWVNMHQSHLDKAITYYKKSLEIREKLENKYSLGYTLFALGYVYRITGQLQEAIDYFTRCLDIRKQIGNKQDIAWTLLNIGDINFGWREIKKAETYYEESLLINQKNNYNLGTIFSLMRLSMVYELTGQPHLVIDMLEKALEYTNYVEIVDARVHVLFDLVYFMTRSGTNLQKIPQYVKRLEKIRNKYRNSRLYNHVYRLSMALMLKEGTKGQKERANKMFQKIVNEEMVDYYYTRIAMRSYSQLLVEQVQKYIGENKLIGQLAILSDELLPDKFQLFYSLMTENFINKTKIALQEIDINHARNMLNQAQYLCDFLQLYNKGSTIFEILYLIFIKERNLNELSSLLDITKGAVSNHLKILTNLDLVEVSREKQVRSARMLKKYYSLGTKGVELLTSLTLNIVDSFGEEKLENDELLKSMIKPRLTTKIIGDVTQLIDNFQQFLEQNVLLETLESPNAKNLSNKEMKQLINIFDENSELFIDQLFLSTKQYQQYLELWKEFQGKVKEEILQDSSADKKSKYVLQVCVPLEELIEFKRTINSIRKDRST